jgi:hypothetical protein
MLFVTAYALGATGSRNTGCTESGQSPWAMEHKQRGYISTHRNLSFRVNCNTSPIMNHLCAILSLSVEVVQDDPAHLDENERWEMHISARTHNLGQEWEQLKTGWEMWWETREWESITVLFHSIRCHASHPLFFYCDNNFFSICRISFGF